jgi:thiosulfate/3-mercaptopyruvate sulfurtransferase
MNHKIIIMSACQAVKVSLKFMEGREGMTQRFPNEHLLVSAQWLMEHLDEAAVRLVEVSTPGAGYTLGHIRNAIYLNLGDVFKGDGSGLTHTLAPITAVAAILGRKGLAPDKHIVVTDENGGARAAQLFWLLEYLGFARISFLEGGVERWLAEGRPQTRKVPQFDAVTFTSMPRAELYADVNWVKSQLGASSVAMIDCRTDEEYHEGHIPGAKNRNWEQTLALKAFQEFRAAAELKAELAALGATENREVVTYCGSGQRSSHTYFTLRLLGYANIRNYIGSWSEWSARNDLPRET